MVGFLKPSCDAKPLGYFIFKIFARKSKCEKEQLQNNNKATTETKQQCQIFLINEF